MLLLASLAPELGSDPPLAYARASLWTNALFLWPALAALALGEDAVALVLAATLGASTLHHGCEGSAARRAALAPAVFVLLAAAALAFAAAVAIVGCARIAAAPADVADRRWKGRARALLGLLTGGGALATVLAAGAGAGPLVAAGRLDGCLYVHALGDDTYASALTHIWATLYLVAALAALFVVVTLFLQTSRRRELGLVWLLLLGALALSAYRDAGFLSTATVYGVLAGALALLAAVRLAACCCAAPARAASARSHAYRAGAVALALALGAAALGLFLTANTAATHALWHVLAAAALYVVIAARRQGRRSRPWEEEEAAAVAAAGKNP